MKTVKRAMALVCMTVCFMAGLAFSGCSHGGSDDESSGGGKNPFAGTEWTSGSANLKFYSDGTVDNGKSSTDGLHYRVDSAGDSYTATLYVDAYGVKQDMATLTISSADASSGEYRLSNSNYPVTLKKVGGSSSGGSSSSGGEGNGGASSGNGSNSGYEGTKGGGAGDQFGGTTWKETGSYGDSSNRQLRFYSYGQVEYTDDNGYTESFDYYFKIEGSNYIATAYNQYSSSKVFTFKYSLNSTSNGTLSFIDNGSYGSVISLVRQKEF